MKHLFPALQAKYRGNWKLAMIGRQLFEPVRSEDTPNYPASYVLVTAESDDRYSTWDSDVQYWTVRFGLVSKTVSPNAVIQITNPDLSVVSIRVDASTWLEEMDAAFKDQLFLSPSAAFTCIGVSEIGRDAPEIEGHTFVAGWSCSFILQMTNKVPRTRV